MDDTMKKYVLTGGPCVGKTTILNEIVKKGYPMIPESARMVIESEQHLEDNYPGYEGVFPWTDYMRYHNRITDLQQRLEASKPGEPILFCDRGLVDNIAYMERLGFTPSEQYLQHVKDANYGTIFLLDQLPIYEKDAQRKESKEEMQEIHQRIHDVYVRMGYDVITVPDIGIENRRDFILERI